MDSVREKASASNEPICEEEKAEFLIAQIANDCNQLFSPSRNICLFSLPFKI